MNFIFISPAFPKTYYRFCQKLRDNGVNVLGIGDTPYDSLSNECKDSLTEYYYLPSLECYEDVFKAVAFYSFKYGKIDYLESNNEYWLRMDARLREDFNIWGPKVKNVLEFTSKSKMKKYYENAQVPYARYKFSTTLEEDLAFIEMVKYPVVAKPDVGVGAALTYKIKNYKDLVAFHDKHFTTPYLLEEYIEGNIISFDGICDENSNVVFCDNEVFPPSIMDIVNENLEVSYYVNKEVPKDVYDKGQAVLKTFNIQKRFFHLEFFRLTKAKEGLGKVGDVVALEVNMRPPGGYTPDLINFAASVDTYKIWADVICFNKTTVDLNKDKYYCVYVGRRDHLKYINSTASILYKYQNNIKMHDRMPDILSDALANEFFVATFKDYDEMCLFRNFVLQK